MPWWEKYRDFIIVGLVVLVILMSIGADLQGKAIPGMEFISGSFIKPVSNTFYQIGSKISDFFYSLKNIGGMKSENERLKSMEGSYDNLKLEAEKLKQENKRLKDLLDYKESDSDYDMIGAQVIGKSSGGWFDIFAVNVGKDRDIKKGMAVVTDGGLTGTVIEVHDKWSKVLSIIDENSSVSVKINKTGDNGILHGDIDMKAKGLASAIYLPMTSNVKKGDEVITSNLGGVYPEGLYIGKVIKVENSHGDLYKTAIIKPGVDFQRLEDVLVIKTSKTGIDLGEE